MAGGLYPAKGNGVYAGGTPREQSTAVYKVKTTTGLTAGRAVMKDTTDAEIKLATAAATTSIGILSRNLDNPEWDGTAAKLVAGDQVEVILWGTGARAWMKNGANLGAGAIIEVGANGAAAAHSVAAAGDADKRVAQRALIDNDGSGVESDVLVVC